MADPEVGANPNHSRWVASNGTPGWRPRAPHSQLALLGHAMCHADIRDTVFAYQGNDGVERQTLPSGRQLLAGQGLQIGGSSHGCGIVALHRLRLLLGMVEVRVEGLAALRDPNQPSGRCWPLHERGKHVAERTRWPRDGFRLEPQDTST